MFLDQEDYRLGGTITEVHALVSKDACNHCPMNMVCLSGKRLLGTQFSFRARLSDSYPLTDPLVCHRCWTVTFVIDGIYYVCGLLRYGHHARQARTPAAGDYVLAALGLASWSAVRTVGPPGGCAAVYDHQAGTAWFPDHPINYVVVHENEILAQNGDTQAALYKTMQSMGYIDSKGQTRARNGTRTLDMSTDDCITFMERDPRFEIEEH